MLGTEACPSDFKQEFTHTPIQKANLSSSEQTVILVHMRMGHFIARAAILFAFRTARRAVTDRITENGGNAVLPSILDPYAFEFASSGSTCPKIRSHDT